MSIENGWKKGLATGLLIAVAACGGDAQADGSGEPVADGSSSFVRVINVEVEGIETSTFSETIRLTGTVKANQDVIISAEESGVVREILAEKGSRVREGQAIFRDLERLGLDLRTRGSEGADPPEAVRVQ